MGDEARVGQKGTLAHAWARSGTRPRAVQDTRSAWAYLYGAVCPERAAVSGLVMPHANMEAMKLHLAEIGEAVARTPTRLWLWTGLVGMAVTD